MGGEYRYEWEDKGRNKKMGMGGVYTKVDKPETIGSKDPTEAPAMAAPLGQELAQALRIPIVMTATSTL